jgi:membrane peptidoglycan carboxypeptidase
MSNWISDMVLSRLALIFLRREWANLARELRGLHDAHRRDEVYRPSWFLQALLLSGEDHRFFTHAGIDSIAICRAIWRGVVFQRREGASTIEMQLVRVLTGRYERTLARKVREAALATLLTRVVPKAELPALYIRVGYFGWRMNGYAAACRRLRLNPSFLTSREAAALIARLKYPEPQTPSEHRIAQIDMRGNHLLALHRKHIHQFVYSGLQTEERYATV